jgi:hypothetical protein
VSRKINKASIKRFLMTILCCWQLNVGYSHDHHPYDAIFNKTTYGFNFNNYSDYNSDERITKKYAELLGLQDSYIKKDIDLYRYIDKWMGTPYLWGGCTMRGVDCSCFVQNLFDDVFGVNIKRTTFTQYFDKNITTFKNRKEYRLGDLVFFKTNISRETRNNVITHVGMYLANGYFVQSSSRGVNIDNIDKGYWKNCFVAAGRVREYYSKIGAVMPVEAPSNLVEKPKISFEEKSVSDFEPIPYPAELEEMKGKYAKLLHVNPDVITFPEVFEYIEKYKYAPGSISGKCGTNIKMNNCFLSSFYKEIMNIDLDSSTKMIFKSGMIGETPNKDVCFLVAIKTNKNLTYPDVMGIYLYNDYFLHLEDSTLAITNIANPMYSKAEIKYYWFYQPVLDKAYDYIEMKRKNLDILQKNILDWEKPKAEEKTIEPPITEPQPEVTTITEEEDAFANKETKKERKKKEKEALRLKKEKEAQEAILAMEEQEKKEAAERAKQEEIYNKKLAEAAWQKKQEDEKAEKERNEKAEKERIEKQNAKQTEAEKIKKQEEEAQQLALQDERKRQEEDAAREAEFERQKIAKAEAKKKKKEEKKAKKNKEDIPEAEIEEKPVTEMKDTTTVVPQTEPEETEATAPKKKSKKQLRKEQKANEKKAAALEAEKEISEKQLQIQEEELEQKTKPKEAINSVHQEGEVVTPNAQEGETPKTNAQIRKEKRKQKKAEKKQKKQALLEE